jgi:hypothetical protein
VNDLLLRTFHAYLALDYSEDGIHTFTGFVRSQALLDRLKIGVVALVAEADDSIVGMIEMRSHSHVTLLLTRPVTAGGAFNCNWRLAF